MFLEQNRLLAAVRELAFARGIDEIAETVRHAARDLTGADGVTFIVRADDECHYIAENAIEPLWAGRRFPIASCISGLVMREGQPAVISDIYADALVPHDLYRPTFVRSLAIVPVRPDDPVGAIGLYWATRHQATAEELDTARTLADATSLAMANVRVYEELQQALQREQRAREAAEASNRAKDEWLSIVSHELRTPLTVIQGRAAMLARPDAPREMRDRAAEAIVKNTALLARVVDDLLDASKMASGKLRIHLEPVDAVSVIRDVLEHARPAAAARAIDLKFDVVDALSVRADPNRLRQILWNLVTNAIKFSPDGAHVTVAAYADADHTVIEVRDTGIGLDASSLRNIFDKFTQVDSSTTRAHGGLGLGLAIAKRLVELHGGTIEAASAGLGAGSTFTVRLPRRRRDDRPRDAV